MALTLYDFPSSPNAQKVRLLLAELGLEFEHRSVAQATPRPDWYLQLNPFGRVPAIKDGDLFLAESHAILRYLAQRSGRDELYVEQRAHVDWALDAWATFVGTQMRSLIYQVLVATIDDEGRSHPERADPERVQPAIAEARRGLAAYEEFCAGTGAVCGSFTIADCAVAPALKRTERLPLDLDNEFPKLAKIRDAVLERPAAVAVWAADVGVTNVPAASDRSNVDPG